MFWDAFILGLGVSVGASIGGMTFVFLIGVFFALRKTDSAKRESDVAELSLKALDLTEKQIEVLERIAFHAGDIAASTMRGN